jgi:hypothetical protein
MKMVNKSIIAIVFFTYTCSAQNGIGANANVGSLGANVGSGSNANAGPLGASANIGSLGAGAGIGSNGLFASLGGRNISLGDAVKSIMNGTGEKGTLFEVVQCVGGLNTVQKCHLSICPDAKQENCNCANVDKIFSVCYSDDKMKANKDCDLSKGQKSREDLKKTVVDGCKAKGLATDQEQGATANMANTIQLTMGGIGWLLAIQLFRMF